MYVTQSGACSVPNSLTPVPSSLIALSQAVLSGMDTLVSNANAAMAAIVQRADLNAAGQPIATNASGQPLPASQQPVAAFDNAPAPPALTQVLQRWPTMCTGRSVQDPPPSPASCFVASPYPPPMPPLTIPPVGVPAPAPAPPASTLPAGWTPPTTGNVCIDIQKGYVQQSQVSAEQLAQCSEKGYYQMGTQVLTNPTLLLQLQQYWTQNAGKLPMIPDQPNLANYSPSMGLAGYRMRGLGAMVTAYRRGR